MRSRINCVLTTGKVVHSLFSRKCSSLREMMRILPQPVLVISSAMEHVQHGTVRRGVTCSSFTSVTLGPPTVLVSLYKGNIINHVIERSGHFAANLLSDQQLREGMHFAKSLSNDLQQDQFSGFDFTTGIQGLPLLSRSAGIAQCSVSSMDVVGDHCVWYGKVLESTTNKNDLSHPMLYYGRSFRTIGDEIFMQAFEDTKLPFEQWTHEAHLRMAWNYITKNGQEKATPLIKEGIMKYNERNKEKITHGYNETVTLFYIHVISKAVQSMANGHTFEEFLLKNNQITTSDFIQKYYSPSLLSHPHSKQTFVEPDRMKLP